MKRLVRDMFGNVTKIVGPDGAIATYDFDPVLHEPVRAVTPTGAEWKWAYDNLGNVSAITTPTGEVTRFEWRDGLVRWIEAPGNLRTEFSYDRYKNIAGVRMPNGAFGEQKYDTLGRLVFCRDARGGVCKAMYDTEGRAFKVTSPAGELQKMLHDPEGNVLETQDSTRQVKLKYGHYNRVVEREEGGSILRFDYDTEDQLIGVINEGGERYSFEIDPAGTISAEIGFDGGRRTYIRDAVGRVIQEVLPSGLTRNITYDRAGRVTEVKSSDGTMTTFEYAIDGALLRAKNNDSDVAFEHDASGRVVIEEVNGVQVTSHFGPDGTRDLMESSLGARQSVGLGPGGSLSVLRHGCNREFETKYEQRFERDALDLEIARVLPGGIRVAWRRDSAGRPLERRTTKFANGVVLKELDMVAYQWRGDDQITAIIDAARGPRFFDIDERGRLTRERRPGLGPMGQDEIINRVMDDVGNLFRLSDRSDRKYGSGGRIEEADGTTYKHDADGNLSLKSSPDGSVWRYHWNGAGMLSEIERPDGRRVRFEYDAFARRIRKTLVTIDDDVETIEHEKRFVWDGNTVVHELSTEEGLTTWYWEPETMTPVAKERENRLWSLASDHQGTPTEMYDEEGVAVWEMRLDCYGEPTIDKGSRTDCPWRWPGQYEDEETDLYYNRHRYYEPNFGGYTSLDPIRLYGGTNLFGYVTDPIVLADPLGLATCVYRGSGDTRVDRFIAQLDDAVQQAKRMLDAGMIGESRWAELYQNAYRGTGGFTEAMSRGSAIQQLAVKIVKRGEAYKALDAAGAEFRFNEAAYNGLRGSRNPLRPDVQIKMPDGRVNVIDITTQGQAASGKINKYLEAPNTTSGHPQRQTRGLADVTY